MGRWVDLPGAIPVHLIVQSFSAVDAPHGGEVHTTAPSCGRRATTPLPTTTAPRPVVAPVTAVPTTAHPAVRAAAKTLAFTGLGPTGILVAVIGGVLVLFGILLFFVDIRKAVRWALGL